MENIKVFIPLSMHGTVVFLEKKVTNFLDMTTTLQFLRAKWLWEKKLNVQSCIIVFVIITTVLICYRCGY